MTKPIIAISVENKRVLDKLKLHPRETYDDVISRFVNGTVLPISFS